MGNYEALIKEAKRAQDKIDRAKESLEDSERRAEDIREKTNQARRVRHGIEFKIRRKLANNTIVPEEDRHHQETLRYNMKLVEENDEKMSSEHNEMMECFYYAELMRTNGDYAAANCYVKEGLDHRDLKWRLHNENQEALADIENACEALYQYVSKSDRRSLTRAVQKHEKLLTKLNNAITRVKQLNINLRRCNSYYTMVQRRIQKAK